MATLINSFEVQPGVDEQFVASWQRTRDYLNERLGAIPTVLPRSLADAAEFRFVNVAQIDAVDEWRAAIAADGFPGHAIPGQAHAALYDVVYKDQVSDQEP